MNVPGMDVAALEIGRPITYLALSFSRRKINAEVAANFKKSVS